MSPIPARRRSGGLTLIELLVAVALGLAILLVASDLLLSSSRSASDVQGRNELLEESQIAQNYVISQLREAVYVFPTDTALNLGADDTTRPPGGAPWRVGDPAWPVVALVRPPQNLDAACSAANPRACYAFLAYYALPREVWVEAVTGENDPGPDGRNADRRVLVEYRSLYASAPRISELDVAGYAPPDEGRSVRLVLDYLQPPALALPGTPPLFVVNRLSALWSQRPGDLSVTVNLAVSRRIGTRDVTVPGLGASGPESVTAVVASPRNLGNLPE